MLLVVYNGEEEMSNFGKKTIDKVAIEKAVREILIAIGEDPDREGLKGTPDRVARMYEEIYSGIHQDPRDHLKVIFQDEEHEELVLVRDVPFYSCCEHHLVPFFGKAHIAYIPDGKVVGLSKLARTVEVYAKRPQMQEQLTAQIADALMEHLKPQGAMVMIEAEHMCMTMRGIKKPGSRTVTYVTRGIFEKDTELQNRFFQMVR